MTTRIPNSGKWSQPNKGEIFGNLYRTQNIDLKTNQGKMRVSPRLTVNTKSNDSGISGMGVPSAFVSYDFGSGLRYAAACGKSSGAVSGTGQILISSSNDPAAVFANDAATNFSTDIHADMTDMVAWSDGQSVSLGKSIFVSTRGGSNCQIKKRFANTWDTTWFTSTVSGTLTSDIPHNLCSAFNGNLYITDLDKVGYVPFSTTGSALNAVQSGTGTLNFYGKYYPIWIRTTSNYIWIGLVSVAGSGSTNITPRGAIARWDGTGTAPQNIYELDSPMALTGEALNDIFHIVDAFGVLRKFNGTGFEEIARLPVANQYIEMPGIYSAFTNTRWIGHRGMSIVDGKINISVNNFVSSGNYVEDMPSGIWEYDPEIGLHHKGSPCADTNDWGQQLLLTAGALFGIKKATATYLAGFGYYTDSGATPLNGIFYDDVAHTTSRKGIFIIPWIDSAQVLDTFQKAIYRFRNLMSGSKIIGKYRTDKSATLPFVAAITWTSNSSFISTDANWQYASVGDEVEVIQGKGASTTGHITQINSAAGTYTVIVDDTSMNFSSGSALVKVNNYRKMGEITQLNSSSQILAINQKDNSVQIKTELRDEGGMELNDLTITSKTQQEAN